MRYRLIVTTASVAVLFAPFVAHAQRAALAPDTGSVVRVDGFESAESWTLETVDDVDASIHVDSACRACGLRLDVDFHGHGGAVTLHSDHPFDLPDNYELRLLMRGTVSVPMFVLTLIDTTDANQWGAIAYNVTLPHDWTVVSRRKRQLGFVHGPSSGDLRRAGALELRIAGLVGKGTIWLRNVSVASLPPDDPFATDGSVLPQAMPHASALSGTWEQRPVPSGGIASTLAFADDGSLVRTIGAMVDESYAVADGRLTTRFPNPLPGTSGISVVPVRVTRDTLVELDTSGAGHDVVMTRARPAIAGDDPVVGVWRYPYQAGATAYVAFARDGQMRFRLPIRSQAGNWHESAPGRGTLVETGPGSGVSSWMLADGALIVTDANGTVTRYERQPPSP